MKHLLVGLAMMTALAGAHGAGSAEAPKCDENGSTQESNACVYDELAAADLELNTVYRAQLSSLPASAQQALRVEQRAWLKMRDPQCKESAQDMAGRSGWVSEFYGCVAAATRARTQQLKGRAAR